jgi:CheY-like chemotaxis protein
MRPNPKSRPDEDVRILVVEDDPNARELLLLQLRAQGMDDRVKFISNGKEALDFLTGPHAKPAATKLVAIFLDLKLPALGGIELLRRLRQREEYATIPVIVMTASSDPSDLKECQRLQVAQYVSKPVSFTSFAKAVADTFHSSTPERRPAMTVFNE